MTLPSPNKKSFTFKPIFHSLICMTMLLMATSSLLAQARGNRGGGRGGIGMNQPAANTQADKSVEQAEIVSSSIAMVFEKLNTLTPIMPAELSQLDQIVKDSKRYYPKYDDKTKINFNLLEAFASASLEGEEGLKDAYNSLRKAERIDESNTNISDLGIALALLAEDYEKATELLTNRYAGEQAMKSVHESWYGPLEPQNSPQGPGGRGAMNPFGRTSTPQNAGRGGRGSAGRFGDPNAVSPQRIPNQTQVTPPKEAGKPLSGQAPINYAYLEEIEKLREREESRQNRNQTQQPGRMPLQRATPYGRGPGNASAGSDLNLPIDFMPPTMLGKDINKMQLRNFNGSYFIFEPGSQILCAFMWSMPANPNSGPGGLPGMGRGGRRGGTVRNVMPGRGGRGGSSYGGPQQQNQPQVDPMAQLLAGNPMPAMQENLQEIITDLDGAAEQFKTLFEIQTTLSVIMPALANKVQFIGINADSSAPQSRVMAMSQLMENAWPWSNCYLEDPANKAALSDIDTASPVIMIVGSSGKVRYVGPVGGFLPSMIIQQELQKAMTSSAISMPTLSAPKNMPMAMPTGSSQNTGGLLQKIFGNSNPNTAPAPTASPTMQTPRQAPQPAAPARPKPTSIENDPTIQKAQQLIQQAYINKRMGLFNKAADFCLEVINGWPNTEEDLKARELLKSIAQSRPRVERDLKEDGRWPEDM